MVSVRVFVCLLCLCVFSTVSPCVSFFFTFSYVLFYLCSVCVCVPDWAAVSALCECDCLLASSPGLAGLLACLVSVSCVRPVHSVCVCVEFVFSLTVTKMRRERGRKHKKGGNGVGGGKMKKKKKIK